MRANELVAAVLTILLVGSAVAPAASAVASTQQQAYAGTHVSFDAADGAVVDYAVDGETMLESVKVQSKSAGGSDGGLGASLDAGAAADIAGAAVSIDARTETGARVTSESGATLRAHDNERGILVVESGGSAQRVALNVSSASRVESQGERRVVVTTENDTEGTFIAVGNASVAAADGNVTGEVGADGRLVFRSYPDGRDENDESEERLIADGEAAAEVYLTGNASAGDSSDDSSDNGSAVDVVRYDENTTVEVTERSEGAVTMTAERAAHNGTVVLTSISNATAASAERLRVSVDGEAAARASSYSDLRGAANGGDSSKFLVRERASAEADAELAIAVNHFSERTITVSGNESDGSESTSTPAEGTTAEDATADGDTATDEGGDAETTAAGGETASAAESGAEEGEGTDTSVPGFGVGAAIAALALAGALGIARRR